MFYSEAETYFYNCHKCTIHVSFSIFTYLHTYFSKKMYVEVLWYHLGIPWYFDMFHDIEQLPYYGNYIILQGPSKNTMVVHFGQ